MHKIWQKGCAMMLASFMVMTALAVFATPVLADESSSRATGRMGWTIDWDDDWMTDDLRVDDEDEQIFFNYDVDANSMYYLGDDEANLTFNLMPSNWNTFTTSPVDSADWWVNITLLDGNATDCVVPGDDHFVSYDPSSVAGSTNPLPDGTSWNNNNTELIAFTIDIKDSGNVENGSYPLNVRISYLNETMVGGTDPVLIDTITINVYVASVFHNIGPDWAPVDDEIDTPCTLTYDGNDGSWGWDKNFVRDDAGDFGFEPGLTFQEAVFEADFDTPFDIIDAKLKLTAPTSGDITLAKDYAQCMGVAATTGGQDFNYRVNVDARTPAGIHKGTAQISFDREDNGYVQNIVESAQPTDFCVDYTYADRGAFERDESGNWYSEYAVVATEVVITDIGEPETNDTVSDDNNTVPDDNNTVPPANNTNNTGNGTGNGTRQIDIFDLPDDTYEQSKWSDKLITFDVTVQNNGNSDLYNVEFWFDPTDDSADPADWWDYFQNPHFFYDPWDTYYDTDRLFIENFPVGAEETFTMQATVVKEVPVGEHRLPIFYEGYYFDEGVLLEDTDFIMTDDDLVAYFSIFVVDGQMDCEIVDVIMESDEYDVDDTTYTSIEAEIENREGYSFIDVVAVADFSGTPFYDPLIGQSDNAMVEGEVFYADAVSRHWGNYTEDDDNITVEFMVDMDTTLTPDAYPFSIELTAVIESTLETVTTTLSAVLEINGYGPRIWIEAFTTTEIVAGDYFDLNLTVANDGDSDLRDAWIYIGADGTEFTNWYPICDFIGQIQRENEGYTDNYSYTENFTLDDGTWMYWDNYTEDGVYADSYDWEGAEVTLEALDIDSAKEIIALNLYIEGVYSSPSAVITLMYIGMLAAGDSVVMDYQMLADKDMVDGKPYVINVEVWGIDSEGDSYSMGGYYGADITVKTSTEEYEEYDPVEPNLFMGGMKIMGLALFIIIVIAILFYVLRKVVFPPKKEEPRPPVQ